MVKCLLNILLRMFGVLRRNCYYLRDKTCKYVCNTCVDEYYEGEGLHYTRT